MHQDLHTANTCHVLVQKLFECLLMFCDRICKGWYASANELSRSQAVLWVFTTQRCTMAKLLQEQDHAGLHLQNVLQFIDLLHALVCGPPCAMPCKPVSEHWLTPDFVC